MSDSGEIIYEAGVRLNDADLDALSTRVEETIRRGGSEGARLMAAAVSEALGGDFSTKLATALENGFKRLGETLKGNLSGFSEMNTALAEVADRTKVVVEDVGRIGQSARTSATATNELVDHFSKVRAETALAVEEAVKLSEAASRPLFSGASETSVARVVNDLRQVGTTVKAIDESKLTFVSSASLASLHEAESQLKVIEDQIRRVNQGGGGAANDAAIQGLQTQLAAQKALVTARREITNRASVEGQANVNIEQRGILAAQKAGYAEQLTAQRTAGDLSVVQERSAGKERVIALQGTVNSLLRLEKGLGEALAGAARTGVSLVSTVYKDTFGKLASFVRPGQDEVVSALRTGQVQSEEVVKTGQAAVAAALEAGGLRQSEISRATSEKVTSTIREGSTQNAEAAKAGATKIRESFGSEDSQITTKLQEEMSKRNVIVAEGVNKEAAEIRTLSEKASSGLLGLASGRGGFGLGLTGLVASIGIGKLFKDGIADQINFTEQTNKTKHVFLEFSQQVQDAAKNAVIATGQTQAKFLQFSSQFGLLLKANGIDTKQSADASVKLVQAGADLASFNNTTIEQANVAIQAGLVGQIRPLRQYGIDLAVAKVKQEAVDQGYAKSTKNVSAYALEQARLSLIMKGAAIAAGDFHNTSNQIANSLRIAKAATTDFFGALSRPAFAPFLVLLQKGTSVLVTLTQILRGQATGAMKVFGDGLKGLAVGLGAVLASKGAIEVVSFLATAASKLASPLGLAVLAVSGLSAGFNILLQNSAGFRSGLDAIGAALKTAFSGIDHAFVAGIHTVIDGVKGLFKFGGKLPLQQSIENAGGAFAYIGKRASDFAADLEPIIKGVSGAIERFIARVAAFVATRAVPDYRQWKADAVAIFDAVSARVSAFAAGLRTDVSTGVDLLQSRFGKLKDTLDGSFGTPARAGIDAIKTHLEALSNTKAFEVIGKSALGIGGAFKELGSGNLIAGVGGLGLALSRLSGGLFNLLPPDFAAKIESTFKTVIHSVGAFLTPLGAGFAAAKAGLKIAFNDFSAGDFSGMRRALSDSLKALEVPAEGIIRSIQSAIQLAFDGTKGSIGAFFSNIFTGISFGDVLSKVNSVAQTITRVLATALSDPRTVKGLVTVITGVGALVVSAGVGIVQGLATGIAKNAGGLGKLLFNGIVAGLNALPSVIAGALKAAFENPQILIGAAAFLAIKNLFSKSFTQIGQEAGKSFSSNFQREFAVGQNVVGSTLGKYKGATGDSTSASAHNLAVKAEQDAQTLGRLNAQLTNAGLVTKDSIAGARVAVDKLGESLTPAQQRAAVLNDTMRTVGTTAGTLSGAFGKIKDGIGQSLHAVSQSFEQVSNGLTNIFAKTPQYDASINGAFEKVGLSGSNGIIAGFKNGLSTAGAGVKQAFSAVTQSVNQSLTDLAAQGQSKGVSVGTALLGGLASVIGGQQLGKGNVAGGLAGILTGALTAGAINPILGVVTGVVGLATAGITALISGADAAAKKFEGDVSSAGKKLFDLGATATQKDKVTSIASQLSDAFTLSGKGGPPDIGTEKVFTALKLKIADLSVAISNGRGAVGDYLATIGKGFESTFPALSKQLGLTATDYSDFVDKVVNGGLDVQKALLVLTDQAGSGSLTDAQKASNALATQAQAELSKAGISSDKLIAVLKQAKESINSQLAAPANSDQLSGVLGDVDKALLKVQADGKPTGTYTIFEALNRDALVLTKTVLQAGTKDALAKTIQSDKDKMDDLTKATNDAITARDALFNPPTDQLQALIAQATINAPSNASAAAQAIKDGALNKDGSANTNVSTLGGAELSQLIAGFKEQVRTAINTALTDPTVRAGGSDGVNAAIAPLVASIVGSLPAELQGPVNAAILTAVASAKPTIDAQLAVDPKQAALAVKTAYDTLQLDANGNPVTLPVNPDLAAFNAALAVFNPGPVFLPVAPRTDPGFNAALQAAVNAGGPYAVDVTVNRANHKNSLSDVPVVIGNQVPQSTPIKIIPEFDYAALTVVLASAQGIITKGGRTSGAGFGGGFTLGLLSVRSTVVAAASILSASAVAGARAASGGMVNVGLAMGDGLILGVRAKLAQTIVAAVTLVNAAIAAAKAAAGIHSPSVVFAGIGENIGQGLANGITSMTVDVASAATTAVDAAVAAAVTSAERGKRALQDAQAGLFGTLGTGFSVTGPTGIADSQGSLTKSLQGIVDSVRSAQQALADQQPTVDAKGATVAPKSQVDDLVKALQGAAAGLDPNSLFGGANRDAIKAGVASIFSLGQNEITAGTPISQAVGDIVKYRQQLIDLSAAAGLNRDEVTGLVDALGLSTASLADFGKEAIGVAAGLAAGAPAQVKTVAPSTVNPVTQYISFDLALPTGDPKANALEIANALARASF